MADRAYLILKHSFESETHGSVVVNAYPKVSIGQIQFHKIRE